MWVRSNSALCEKHGFQNQVNRLFNEGFGARGGEEESAAAWAPPVDISETPDTLNFTVELPGFKNEELTLRVENGVLALEGERQFEAETKEKNFHRVERSYGKFVRAFTLPSNVDPEKVRANLTDGILQIALSKRQEAKSKTISIGAGSPKQIVARKAA
ncbi:MAG: Hsp20/alpha crystallin family protein [Thermoanaerobaculia bacterium]